MFVILLNHSTVLNFDIFSYENTYVYRRPIFYITLQWDNVTGTYIFLDCGSLFELFFTRDVYPCFLNSGYSTFSPEVFYLIDT